MFFGITFAFTWGFWIPAIVFNLAFDNALGLLLLLLGLLGPGITGVALVKLLYTESARKDFWDRVINIRRIGLQWYLAVFLYAPVTFAVAAGIDVALGGTGYIVADWVSQLTSNPAAFLPTCSSRRFPPCSKNWAGVASLWINYNEPGRR